MLINLCGICRNYAYAIFNLGFVDEKEKFDELVEDKGVKILIDPKALMHVIGTQMDFVDDKLRFLMPFLITLAFHIVVDIECLKFMVSTYNRTTPFFFSLSFLSVEGNL